MKKFISSILVSILVITGSSFASTDPSQSYLKVSYIDVGQADCQLIQTPGGKNILIDATYGRRTRAVLVMDSNHVVLSAIQPETVAHRATQNDETEE